MRKLTTAQILVLASTLAIGTVNANDSDEVATLGRVTSYGVRPSGPGMPYGFNVTWAADRYSGTSASYGRGSGSGGSDSRAPDDPTEDCHGRTKPEDQATKGNPVVLATGNKVEPEIDFASQGEMGLRLRRTYNHFWPGGGLFGKHWVSSFDYKLSFGTTALNNCHPRPGGGACGIGANTLIYAWRPNGSIVKYVKAADGAFYQDAPNPISRIIRQADGSFVLHGKVGEQETYSSAGYVSTVRNEHGIGWSYSYTGGTFPQRVTHTSGRYVEFTWTSGQLTAVRDPAGNYHGYAYAANRFGTGLHRLSASTAPGSPQTATVYHYEIADASALTGKSINGARYSTFTYSATGLATSTEHSGGQDKHTFSYTTGAGGLFTVVETNPLGKKTTYVFKNGKRESVTGQPSTYCPAGSALYEYDANGNAVMKSDFNGNNTAYKYNDRGQMTEETEGYGTSQSRTTQYEWDANLDRLKSITIVGLSRTSYTYGADNRIASQTVTNLTANGVANQSRTLTFTYTKHPSGMLETVAAVGTLIGSADNVTLTYSAAGDLIERRNGLAHKVAYGGHNGLGQPGRETGANGEITDYTYDARGRVTRVRTYPNGTTAADTIYTYLGNGRLGHVKKPDGQVRGFQYDAALRMVGEYEQEAGQNYAYRSYTYNAASLPTSVVVGRNGYVPGTAINGFVDGVSHDAGSNYRIRGWACSTYMNSPINVHFYAGGPAGSGTLVGGYTADKASESAVAAECRAQGTAYRYEIPLTDAIRQQHGNKAIHVHGISPTGTGNSLLANSGSFVVPALGGSDPEPPFPDPNPCPRPDGLPCQLPMAGRLNMQAVPGAMYGSYTDYDELGRVRARRGNNGQDVRYTYDPNGNVKTVTDSLNRVTTLTYDALDRLTQSKDPLNGITRYEYNAADQLVKVTDPRNQATTYTYDGFGQLWRQVSPDTGATAFTYNISGQRTSMTRADGGVTTYGYDSLGRLTLVAAGGKTQGFTYDNCGNGKGRVCQISDQHGQLDYTYNSYGQRLTQGQKIGASTINFGQVYVYDAIGRLTGISYPGGVSVGYGYLQGKLSAMTVRVGTTIHNVVSGIQYLPFGPATSWNYGNGLSRSLSYDPDSRLTELDTRDGGAHLQRLGYQYTQNDQIQNITNHVEPNLTVGFAYDALNRLVQHGKAATATYTSYSYDLNGNRTATGGGSADGQGPITPYQTAPGSNRLMAVGTSSFAYDANGNTIADGSRHYDYDAFNRLHRVSNAGGTHEYAINALGQRVWKQTGNGAGPSYAFTYGPSGQVEAEYAWATNSWTHYLRLPGGEPVALVRGNQRYMIHTEHLGRPEIVTNSAKAVVWRANNRSFDRGVKLDSIGGLNLGFPGQYWDQESGLWYNHFRSYDPLTGRYIESDPIGLAGGLNTYAYAFGNPVVFIDPYGLCVDYLGLVIGIVDVGEGMSAAAGGLVGAVITGAAGQVELAIPSLGTAAFGAMTATDGARAIATALDGKERTSSFQDVGGALLGAHGSNIGYVVSHGVTASGMLRGLRRMSMRAATDSDLNKVVKGINVGLGDPCPCE